MCTPHIVEKPARRLTKIAVRMRGRMWDSAMIGQASQWIGSTRSHRRRSAICRLMDLVLGLGPSTWSKRARGHRAERAVAADESMAWQIG